MVSSRKKIPVLKNKLPVLPKSKKDSSVRTGYIFLIFVIMLFFVWLRVQTNETLTDIKSLEDRLRKIKNENSHLETQVNILSDYIRIAEIAQDKLGMVIVPNDKIIKITEKD